MRLQIIFDKINSSSYYYRNDRDPSASALIPAFSVSGKGDEFVDEMECREKANAAEAEFTFARETSGWQSVTDDPTVDPNTLDKNECNEFAIHNGMVFEERASSHNPPGCYMHEDRRVIYNGHWNATGKCGEKAVVQYHLAPPASLTCGGYGEIAIEAECAKGGLEIVQALYNQKPGRMQAEGEDGYYGNDWSDWCGSGGWGDVPAGCAVQIQASGYTGDFTPHFRRHEGNGANCNPGGYRLALYRSWTSDRKRRPTDQFSDV